MERAGNLPWTYWNPIEFVGVVDKVCLVHKQDHLQYVMAHVFNGSSDPSETVTLEVEV